MAEEIPQELGALFRDEASQLLAEYEEALLLLEATPRAGALVDRLFRVVHTLKGNSGILGLDVLATFAHELEDLLARVRDGRLEVSLELVEALFAGGDVLRALLAAALDGAALDESLRDRVLAMMRAFTGGGIAPPRSIALPAPAAPEPSPLVTASRAPAPPGHAPQPDAGVLRIRTEKVDHLIDLVGELVVAHSTVANVVGKLTPERMQDLRDAVTRLERRCRDLHESVLAIRMVQVKTAFTKFQRLVRDAAASVGKDVKLELVGEETEIDRTVLDKVSDALTHVLRNAVDHGIEARDERRATGKPETGRITLSAHARSGYIFVEVTDDGRGLDCARILAKARARGMVAEDERMSEEQIFDLIFRAGFSTADAVTELSGRGVGMDVVRQTVEALKGTVAVTSRAGAGTCIKLKLPLTLALLDGLVVRAAQQTFIVPLASVLELLRPVPEQLHVSASGGEVVELRGELLQIVRLRELAPAPRSGERSLPAMIVIVDDGVRRFALATDEVLGQSQVVVKSLDTNGWTVPGLAGATILGDGSIALLLDVSGVAAAVHAERVRRTTRNVRDPIGTSEEATA